MPVFDSNVFDSNVFDTDIEEVHGGEFVSRPEFKVKDIMRLRRLLDDEEILLLTE